MLRNGRLNREAFAGHVEPAGKVDLEEALHVWVECAVGGHVLLQFHRIDEYFGGDAEVEEAERKIIKSLALR